MSDITAADVAHLADLARIDLTEDEVAVMTEQLVAIQPLIEQVKEVATPEIPPASHPHVMSNVLRPDEPAPTLDRADALAGAPDQDGEQFRVPAILGEE
ncbi:Asp-tRNA(Asn)/Glu-tRNA(Gln) amidotransferase subunit GatC [Gulosibacter sp. 10]|uniref:Asp-tRNA(Asn)/Glu-tRNA(Gln) amidotransferase subunit GatC n=1 Tax=Gulosibacter sp. 10 TaxID=1255570 RepID=UPI00097F2342|nr:Asp-tRNA(Asn)/Glu-tRNA(Gln) amidotransferase subunit GatC [Gulosibacter sp. 10]SJM51992.1 Aspartyl-tRNA(Asn) amidotransferase subunit C amidotransferase subunit C [Gulosibacter sp. 10]